MGASIVDMILDFTQWTRLQNNVKRALPFFIEYYIHENLMKYVKRIADTYVHQLSQFKKVKDLIICNLFFSVMDDNDFVPLEMIINFANGVRSMDRPVLSAKSCDECDEKIRIALEKNEDWVYGWTMENDFIYKSTSKNHIHTSISVYGKIVWYEHEGIFKDKDIKPVKQKGIVISKTEYIPVSVEF